MIEKGESGEREASGTEATAATAATSAGRTAIVLADGLLASASVVRWRLQHVTSPLTIAADGGARHAHALGIAPDEIVGDLDSIAPALLSRLRSAGTMIHAARPDKDETDLELALLRAAALGASRLIVLAALGGRLDMTLSNLLLLTHPALKDLQIELWDAWETAWLIRPPGGPAATLAAIDAPLAPELGDRLSLVPLAGDALGVTTHGLQYPLHDEPLSFGLARGVSNVIMSSGAAIVIRSGVLLAVHSPSDDRIEALAVDVPGIDVGDDGAREEHGIDGESRS